MLGTWRPLNGNQGHDRCTSIDLADACKRGFDEYTLTGNTIIRTRFALGRGARF